MLKSSLVELILSTCGAKAVMRKIRPPGAHFVDFWSQGQKMLKSSLLELILSTSRAEAGNCSSWNSEM